MGKRKMVDQDRRAVKDDAMVETLSDVVDAINFLDTRCSNEAVARIRGNSNLEAATNTIEKTAGEIGLSPEQIETLVDVIGCSKLPKGLNHRLIKSLIPATVVPYMAVVKAISWMTTSLLASDTKALCLQWMLVVFNSIDDKEVLHRLYHFLFLFINNTAMRPYICHLLYLLTRKEDVRLFRIRALLQIHQSSLPQSYVLGLLSVYKVYCPHLVAISIARSRKTFFRQTDQVWSAKVRKVLSANGPSGSLFDNPDDLLPKPADFYYVPKGKRSKPGGAAISGLQVAKASAVVIPQSDESQNRVPLSQIRSFDDLLKNIDNLELSSPVEAVLMNVNMQHVLACLPDPVMPLRISCWFRHMLYEEFLNTYAANESRQEYLLRLLVQLSEFLQEGLPVCENFLSMYLPLWNGALHRPLIFKLISRCRLYPIAELNEIMLEPLRKLFFCSSVYFKSQVIICFTELLQNFAQFEYPRYKYTLDLQTKRANTSADLPDIGSVFSQDVEEFSALGTIRDFIAFVDSICVVGMQQENSHLLLLHCILGFFEQVAGLYVLYSVPLFCVPSYGVWYGCLFHHSAMVIARLCALVCKYRESYKALQTSSQQLTEDEHRNKKSSLHRSIFFINAYMTDMCDMLWRNRAFPGSMPLNESGNRPRPGLSDSSIFRLATTEVLNHLQPAPHLHMRFAVYFNRAFLGFSYKFLKSNPDSNDQTINPAALKQCKDIFLEFLEQEHVYGVWDFIKNCIKRNSATGNNLTREKNK